MDKRSVKVLVVDDDPFVRDMLAMILQTGEYEVDTAGDGMEALDKYKAAADIGLVISDMNMPKMGGLQLIRELRKMESDVPIIILTGNNEISVAVEAMNTGASDYLLKDEFIQDTVLISADKVLEKHELKRKNLQLTAELAIKNARLEKDLLLAQKVQKNILPHRLDFKGVDIETFYRPSDKIGGDFFDAWEVNGSLHFMLGDVSGHGPSSALIMAACKGMLHSLGYSIDDVGGIVSTANRMLCDILSDSGMFVSLVYGIIDRGDNALEVLSAGHNPVYLRQGDSIKTISAGGPVLGWDPEDSWDIAGFPFDDGVSLFLYTDGVTEAKNRAGEEFGEERLCRHLADARSPKEHVDGIFAGLSDFCSGDYADDITMFMIRRTKDNG